MRRRSGYRPVWPLLPTLMVNWLFYAQLLSFAGVVLWVVLPSLAQIVIVRGIMRTGLRNLAFVVGAVLTPAWALAADVFGGAYSGPVARSALVVSGLTLAGLVLLTTRMPILILLPAGAMMLGALGLGAAGASEALAGLWACAGIATLLMIGPYRREDLRERSRVLLVVRALLISGLTAVAGTTIASSMMGRPWTSSGLLPTMLLGPMDPNGRPSFFDAVLTGLLTLVQSFTTPASLTPGVSLPWVEIARWAILVLIVSQIALPLLRRGYAWLEWRILRERLLAGDARQRALGAWTWTRMRRQWRDDPLPGWASPDIIQALAEEAGDEQLSFLAGLARRIAYDPTGEVTDDEADQAWAIAMEMDTLEDEVTVAEFWRWSRHRPGRVRKGQRLALMPA